MVSSLSPKFILSFSFIPARCLPHGRYILLPCVRVLVFVAYWLFIFPVNTGAMCFSIRCFFGIRRFTKYGIKQELERERERERENHCCPVAI